MRVVTDWRHYPRISVHPTQNTGNGASGASTNNHQLPSTTVVETTSSLMRASSEAFNEIWNPLKPLVALINWSLRSLPPYRSQFIPCPYLFSRLTYTHHHDLNSRHRPFNQRHIIPHALTPAPFSSPRSRRHPSALWLFVFPAFFTFHSSHTLVLRSFFSHFFTSVSIFASLLWLGSGSRPLINRPLTTPCPVPTIFSDPSNFAYWSSSGSTVPRNLSGNSKQYHMGKHLDIFIPLF